MSPEAKRTVDEIVTRELLADPKMARRVALRRAGIAASAESILGQIQTLERNLPIIGGRHETDEKGNIVKLNPDRAQYEETIAGWWQRLLEEEPEAWGKQALKQMGRLLHWTKEQKQQALDDFNARYTQGGGKR